MSRCQRSTWHKAGALPVSPMAAVRGHRSFVSCRHVWERAAAGVCQNLVHRTGCVFRNSLVHRDGDRDSRPVSSVPGGRVFHLYRRQIGARARRTAGGLEDHLQNGRPLRPADRIHHVVRGRRVGTFAFCVGRFRPDRAAIRFSAELFPARAHLPPHPQVFRNENHVIGSSGPAPGKHFAGQRLIGEQFRRVSLRNSARSTRPSRSSSILCTIRLASSVIDPVQDVLGPGDDPVPVTVGGPENAGSCLGRQVTAVFDVFLCCVFPVPVGVRSVKKT